MSRQIIICVEANKKSRTDYIYIKDILDYYYDYNQYRTSIKPIFMDSKYNYNKTDIEKQISEKKKQFYGETSILICVDTDKIHANYEDKSFFEKVRLYCNEKEYDLVWFCSDIEEVCLGSSVLDGMKVKEAKAFRRKNMVEKIETKKIEESKPLKGRSNILVILDKYLSRKK